MNVADAVRAMGPGALTEEGLRRCVFPLFSKTLARPGIYLANHSLGRPLDRTEEDLREGFRFWQSGWVMRGILGWRRSRRIVLGWRG